MGKIIAFSNQKGGVGKTTTCINVASYLALSNKKVLLIDMDPQGNATTGFGYNKKELKKSVYNVIIEGENIEDVKVSTCIDNLYLLPSNIDLAGAEIELVSAQNRDKKLFTALQKVRENYDYIVIDCPPSLGMLTLNSLVTSDSVIIPLQAEYYSLEGLGQLLNTVKLVSKINKNLSIGGVVITMFDKRAIISRQIYQEIKDFFKDKVFDTTIPKNVRLSEAPSYGKPIVLHDPKSKGAMAYKELTLEFLRREKENG